MSGPAGRVLARFAPKPWVLVVTVLGLALFAATAVVALLMLEPDAADGWELPRRLALWAAIVFCPVYAWDALQRLRHGLPSLVATEEGLVFRSILGFTPPVPWSEIEAIGPAVLGKKLYLAVALHDPGRSLTRFGTLERLLHVRSHAAGQPNITLRGIQLGMNAAEAARTVEEFRVAAGR